MKTILSAALMVSVGFVAIGQNTNFGVLSGTSGTNFSYFGWNAGNAATAGSSNNSYFGSSSGRMTTSGNNNTAVGFSSLYTTTTGYWNTAIGASSLYSNTTGHNNTAVGKNSMYANQGGYDNTATGSYSLQQNTSGIYNTAIGSSAMYQNWTGNNNAAFGAYALYGNNNATNNTGVGYQALYSNTNGMEGVAIGSGALYSDQYGYSVAVGYRALYNSNTTLVGRNLGVGHSALLNTSTGGRNTGVGNAVMLANTTGSLNTAVGFMALGSNTTGQRNSAFGDGTLDNNATGNDNSAFGSNAGPNSGGLSNTTALGANTIVYSSNYVRVGDSFVTSIGGYAVWSNISDGRFKKDVKEGVPGLNFINQLRPVSYILDRVAIAKFSGMPDSLIQNRQITQERQTGFIAQEVEQIIKNGKFVFDGIEAPQNDNEHYGIRYAQFVVPLVKAIQELNAKVEEQQQTINALLSKNDSSEGKNVDSQGSILYDATPNPFSNETEVKMKLPETVQRADLMVYNMEGKQLKSFSVSNRGETALKIGANELAAGMYLYALIADGKVVATKRMVLTR